MQLFLSNDNDDVISMCMDNTLFVHDINKRMSLPYDLELYVHGRRLHQEDTLLQAGLQNGSSIDISLCNRLLGGAQLGKAVKGKSKDKKKKTGDEKSEEEKAIQDRIQRMEMNDYQKKLAAASKEQLKTYMEKENKNSKTNKLKIQNQWRKIMRLAKVESLRKDIEIFSQNHERDVDRKDAIIQMLDRDVEESEEQQQMALRSQLQNVDGLIDLQDTRLLSLENEFETELHSIETEFKVEKEKVIKQVV